jgi:hypothetical protein
MADSTSPATTQPHITVGIDGFSVPVEEVLQGRGFITGKSGSGKSNSIATLSEQLLDAGYPLLIFDIDGEYVSLKEAHDVLHVGADQYCEKVIGPEHADALAKVGIDQRQPILVDLSGFAEHEQETDDHAVTQDEIVAAIAQAFFARAGYAKREHGGAPYLIVAEEMHEYVPQTGCLSAAGRALVKIGKRGRKRGLGIVGVSQRPASVDKDYITQCDWLVWHRLYWDSDTRVVKDILGTTYADNIENLGDGEAYVLSDWEEDITTVQMKRRQTTDLGEAPGLNGHTAVDLKDTDTSVLDELDEAAEEARTKQARIDQLEDRLEEVKAERDKWKDRYEEAEYLAEVSAEVQQAQQNHQPSACVDGTQTTPDTVTVDMDGATITVPDRLKADVLEIQEAKSNAEALAADYREAATFWWNQWRSEVNQPLPPEIKAQLEDYNQLITELSDLLAAHQTEAADDSTTENKTQSDGDTNETPVEELPFGDLLERPRVQDVIDSVYEDGDSKRGHYTKFLRVLSVAEQPLTVPETAKSFDVSESTIYEVAANLHAYGLVEKKTDGNTAKYEVNRTFIECRLKATRV